MGLQCNAGSLIKWSRIFQLSVTFTLQKLKPRAESDSSWTLKTWNVKATKSCKALGTPDCSVMTHRRNHFLSFGYMTTPSISAKCDRSIGYWEPGCAHQLAVHVTEMEKPCSAIVWTLLTTDSILLFPVRCVCMPSHTNIVLYHLTQHASSFRWRPKPLLLTHSLHGAESFLRS
jgi:hypothetical protein